MHVVGQRSIEPHGWTACLRIMVLVGDDYNLAVLDGGKKALHELADYRDRFVEADACASRASSKVKKPRSCPGRGETSGRLMGTEDMAQRDPFRAIQ